MTLRETATRPARPTSPIRVAVKADLKATRRRLYALIQQIDSLICTKDDDELLTRATPLIRAVRRLPDA
jgi:hypothetical protein